MNTYAVVYEHRHGVDLLWFFSDVAHNKINDYYSQDREALAKVVGISEYEPERGESYEIYCCHPPWVQTITAEDFTVEMTKARLTE